MRIPLPLFAQLFSLDISVVEIVVRGTIIYLGLFVMMRVALRRQTGAIGLGDMLFIALISEAAQNALAGEHRSLPAGLLLVATLIFWCVALDVIAYRFPGLRLAVADEPLLIVRNGKVLPRHLDQAHISREEIETQARLEGLERIDQIKRAYVESEGHISIIPEADAEATAKLHELVERLERLLAKQTPASH